VRIRALKEENTPIGGSVKPRKGKKKDPRPIKRFLRSNVNRPWDKVYKDIRKKDNPFYPSWDAEYLSWYVELDVELDEKGKPRCKRAGWKEDTEQRIRTAFYVCPKSGCLKVTPKNKRKAYPPAHNWRVVERKTYIARDHDRFWFELVEGQTYVIDDRAWVRYLKRKGFESLTEDRIFMNRFNHTFRGRFYSLRGVSKVELVELGIK
jgi:hypothetical protein